MFIDSNIRNSPKKSTNFNILLFLSIFLFSRRVECGCHLPGHWSGKWYQNKDTEPLGVNRTHFINRGLCIEHRQDKFIFYENKEECYRCIFIMQKHPNVLQFRASYCTDQSDFHSNCENLSPESELITIYRDNSVSEKCPLSGLYVLSETSANSLPINAANDDRTYRSSGNNKCDKTSYKDSMIMECSDQSMLKLQFGKCHNQPTFIINCVAHWAEGNANYLIGRVSTSGSQRPSYRCLVFTESGGASSPENLSPNNANNRRARFHETNSDFVDLTRHEQSGQDQTKSTIQVSISQDEFCRGFDNLADEQLSFTFTKVLGSKYHVAPPPILTNDLREKRQILFLNSNNTFKSRKENKINNCKFPKWLNRHWRNLKQTKLFTLDYKLDSLLVLDEKTSTVINKYTCAQMKLKKSNHVQAVVKSLNGCSSGFQCLTISAKSDFVLEIKFGKISFVSADIDCSDNYISQEFVYVDTNFGVKCPLKSGLYEKLDSKANYRAMMLQSETGPSNHHYQQQQQQPCKYLTQTQTLHVGCQNDQQYSLRTKLCYPNHQYKSENPAPPATSTAEPPHTNIYSYSVPSKHSGAAYTQLESEINLVCLAHWKQDGNHVIVSRTMSNEILCSIWLESEDRRFLQLLEIDSDCNYNKRTSQRLNFGFVFINSCDEKVWNRASSSSSSSSSLSSASLFMSSSSSSSFCLFKIFKNFSVFKIFLFYKLINMLILVQ